MTTLKDILSKFDEEFQEADFWTGNGEEKAIKQFISTAIQETLESLQGEERKEAYEDAAEEFQLIGWNAREKKLREDMSKFLS